MNRLASKLLVLVILGALQTMSLASEMTASVVWVAGVPGAGRHYERPIALPDLSTGGSVLLGSSYDLPSGWDQWTLTDPGNSRAGISPKSALDVNSDFGLTIQLDFANTDTTVSLTASGTVTGHLTQDEPGWRYAGGYSGVANGFDPNYFYYPYQSGPIDLPQPILDLIQHPERIHVSGSAHGVGGFFTYATTLTIDPPSPSSPTVVPEPSTWTLFFVLSAGLVGYSRHAQRRSKGSRANQESSSAP
jgi:hypothetical protein